MDRPATPDPQTLEQAAQLIAGRYRLERQLSASDQGVLWRGTDQLAGGLPVALREIPADQPQLQAELRQLWPRLQGVLHPQVPRFGELI